MIEENSGATALIVIDVQNDYCHAEGVFHEVGMELPQLPALVDRINELVDAARSSGVPVVWVRMEWPDDESVGLLAERSAFLRHRGLRAGTWGAELVAGLHVAENDHVVVKQRFSAFHRTALDEILVGLGVRTIAVAGVRTDFCVESTVRDGAFRDYRMYVDRDAVAGYFDELHNASLRVMNTVFAHVVPHDDCVSLLKAARPAEL